MAWFDDDTPQHPKLKRLSATSFQWWFAIICYASKYGSGGRADEALRALSVPSPTRAALVATGLLDDDEDGLWIHDWQEYNGKREAALEERRAQARERQRRHRAKIRGSVTRDRSVTERDSHGDVTRDRHALQERDVTQSSSRESAPAGGRDDHDQEEDYEPSSDEKSREGPREPSLTSAADAQAATAPPFPNQDSPHEQEPWAEVLRDL